MKAERVSLTKTQKRISLKDVQVGVNYVMIISTDAGLWAYNIGDTVEFTSTNPYQRYCFRKN